MLAGVLVVVVLALALSAALSIWIKRAASCGRTIDAPAADPIAVFYGGVMSRHLITSGSLVRLELFDWGVRVRGTLLSKWIVPTWEARYDELATAELVALRWSRVAVWFRLRGAPGGIGFLANGSEEIARQLERRNLPVNRSVTRISRVADLYRLPE